MCPVLRHLWLICLGISVTTGQFPWHQPPKNHAPSVSHANVSQGLFWPTFREGINLERVLPVENQVRVLPVENPVNKTLSHHGHKKPYKKKKASKHGKPHKKHHQHEWEYWKNFIDTHEEKDASHAHDDEIHFQNNTFGYETDHHCIYDLRLNYIYGSPDGVWKRMIAYNGQFPGPTLYCTTGKTMIVRVTNEIEDDDEPTSVHWHGIQQTLTPFYDGPQAISQCPLTHSASFIYKFPVFQAGTYWYHSHHSYQYIDGNWGFLVIKNSPAEVWQNSYDDERLISLNDWTHRTARELAHGYIEHGLAGYPSVNSTLINGRGTFNCSNIEPDQICNPSLQGPAIVKVSRGKRYRLRILNSSAQNAYNFSIDGHKMVVIETDGVDTQKGPKSDILYIIPGQRYSVIVHMDQPEGEYWMRAVSEPPELAGPPGLGILEYEDIPEEFQVLSQSYVEPTEPDERVGQGRAHHHDVPWEDVISSGGIKIPTTDELKKYFPKTLVPINLQLQSQLDGEHARLLNSTRLPTSSPVDPTTAVLVDDLSLTPPLPLKFGPDGGSAPANYDRVVVFNVTDCPTEENKARLCMNEESWEARNLTSVPILHAAIKGHRIEANQIPIFTPNYQEVVRIVINNFHPWSHPWHLHGHTFWLLGAGVEGAGPFNATRDEQLLTTNGVRRDTIRTKGDSWAVVAYITDNPGVWFFHCHIAWHLEAGLGATFIEAAKIARRIYHVSPYESKQACARVGVKI